MGPVWRIKPFRLLFAGQLISAVGSSLFMIALFWYVEQTTHRPQSVVLLGFLMSLPQLGTMLTGVVADRFDRRKVMLVTDVLRFILVGILTGYVANGGKQLGIMAAIFLLLNILGEFFSPAAFALIPEVVPEDQLAQANGLMDSSSYFSNAVGAALGGLLISVIGIAAIFGFDAFSFLVSVASLGLLIRFMPSVHSEKKDAAGKPPTHWTKDLREGWHFLWDWPILRKLLPAILWSNLWYAPLFTLMPAWSAQVIHTGSQGYGFLEAALSVGLIVGGMTAGRVVQRLGIKKGLMLSLGLSVILLAFPAVPRLWADLAVLSVYAFSNGITNTIFLTVIQKITPNSAHGRVMGTMITLFGGLVPLGTAVAGVLVGFIGVHNTFWASAVAMSLGAGYIINVVRGCWGIAAVDHPQTAVEQASTS
ncbi:MAG: MFS transporter [Firmicutes bacterium]|nr:MFS transporter [Bacillota bacterium]